MKLIPYRRRYGFPLSTFRGAVDDLFDRFFNGQDDAGQVRDWMPAVDLAQTDEALIVKAEVPGLKADEIELAVQDNTLTISGEKKDVAEESGEHYYHVERRYGSFHRSITLPSDVDATKIDAKCTDGVLTITLPKAEETKPHRIEIKNE